MELNTYEKALLKNIIESYIRNQELFIIDLVNSDIDAHTIQQFVDEAEIIKEKLYE
jgi:hypothetical protein